MQNNIFKSCHWQHLSSSRRTTLQGLQWIHWNVVNPSSQIRLRDYHTVTANNPNTDCRASIIIQQDALHPEEAPSEHPLGSCLQQRKNNGSPWNNITMISLESLKMACTGRRGSCQGNTDKSVIAALWISTVDIYKTEWVSVHRSELHKSLREHTLSKFLLKHSI